MTTRTIDAMRHRGWGSWSWHFKVGGHVVRRHQTPVLRVGLREQRASTFMRPILSTEQRKEPARVDKNALQSAS